MNYSLNVKSSSIVLTLLSNCVKLLGKVQKLLIKCISYSVISKRIRVVSPKFYTVRKNCTGPPVPLVPTNLKSAQDMPKICLEDMPKICPNHSQDMSKIFPRDGHWAYLGHILGISI